MYPKHAKAYAICQDQAYSFGNCEHYRIYLIKIILDKNNLYTLKTAHTHKSEPGFRMVSNAPHPKKMVSSKKIEYTAIIGFVNCCV